MRIKSIGLSWFRGAADMVSLEPACKSMVVYGVNGAGKSSFVDALEYVLNDGKIQHLAHEYSGKHQEKAIPNTHMPEGRTVELRITFADDSDLRIEIRKGGVAVKSGPQADAARTWDYRRTVLRQDEVSAFIHDTKGQKYSALLPLLGLYPLEVTAENLRQLAKSIATASGLADLQLHLKEVATLRATVFGTASDAQILKKIEDLHSSYCPTKQGTNPLSRCNDLQVALETRTAGSSDELKRYHALQRAASVDITGHVDAVRTASRTFTGAVEPLIVEKLKVLQSAGSLVDRLEHGADTTCPACGRSLTVELFQTHVRAERERLREMLALFEARKAAVAALCQGLESLRSHLSGADMQPWHDELPDDLAEKLTYLAALDTEQLRISCTEEDLGIIQANLAPLTHSAASALKGAPPDAQRLSKDKATVEAANTVFQAGPKATTADRAVALIAFIESLERGIRKDIRLRSETVIADLSADIQAMWGILHPGELIEDVRLYVPGDSVKAIDISLKFHGVAQDSPRLTLSEGHRNSLGLSIFLAMAKREADQDRPLVLDDVVVSLDRNHRGMIHALLEKEFSARQVIILTHDREWYTELRQQLDESRWVFKALMPYQTPSIGIRWSHKTTTFEDARAQLAERPDSAGNDARKIMDVELALVAETLQIRLPYLRGEKNERRMAHDFLARLIADGKLCFQTKIAGKYESFPEAISAFEEADRLLQTWGNRASHTFDLVRAEAVNLLDSCERALERLRCSSCGKRLWHANVPASESFQCECGQIRWRSGKGKRDGS